MRTYQQLLQAAIILLILAMNCYAIGYAIRIESGWAILAAMASLMALAYCIHLFRRLRQLDVEDDYEGVE